jgi:hypothetical protein
MKRAGILLAVLCITFLEGSPGPPLQQLREAMAQKKTALLVYHNLACVACASLVKHLGQPGDREFAVISVDTDDEGNQPLLNADKKGTS